MWDIMYMSSLSGQILEHLCFHMNEKNIFNYHYFYVLQDMCWDIYEGFSNIKLFKAQLAEVLTEPTPTAAVQRCYLD